MEEKRDEKKTKHLEAFEGGRRGSNCSKYPQWGGSNCSKYLQGTLNALAASRIANVKRVVLTSVIVPNPKSPPNTLFHPCCVNYLTLARENKWPSWKPTGPSNLSQPAGEELMENLLEVQGVCSLVCSTMNSPIR
eukprot:Gb_36183 [translate_table: standard]